MSSDTAEFAESAAGDPVVAALHGGISIDESHMNQVIEVNAVTLSPA